MPTLWDEACRIPEAISLTLDRRQGFDAVLDQLAAPDVSRIVVSGNGAAYYAGMALWLASLERASPVPIIALPAGIVGSDSYSWSRGDVLLAVSSSGEFRDVLAAVARAPRAVAVTARPDSSLGTAASRSAIVQVLSQQSATHTQAYCTVVATLLALWAELTGDAALRRDLDGAAGAVHSGLASAEAWAAGAVGRVDGVSAAVAFGTGPGWAAALEAALLLKEVAGVPSEGVETREGATSSMYSLRAGHLVLSIGSSQDAALVEAEDVCRTAGATVIQNPPRDGEDGRLLPLLSFPFSLAFTIGIATRAGIDVDNPSWLDAYTRTARHPAGGPIPADS